jgi:hypothetical protein
MNLAEFAAQEKGVPRPGSCKVCDDPRAQEINEGHAQGMPLALIARWARANGAPISESTVGAHFLAGHDTRS